MDLGDNSRQDICRKCGNCCFNTELELSDEDIERISKKTGMEREEFAVFNGELWQLKNIDGHCVFLKPERDNFCSIYDFRPFGCMIYPLVYDIDTKTCRLDEFCPHRKKFYRNRKHFIKTCKILKDWIKNNFNF